MDVINNCPYVNLDTVSAIKDWKTDLEKQREKRNHLVGLYRPLKPKIKTQSQLDEHRRQGHLKYSPDCPECKRGAAKQRAHQRLFTRQGGELSVDIAGPYAEGLPVTDRKVASHQNPKYMLVGAFTPFGKAEVKARYEQ